MAATASQVQDHASHHTRGFGVALDALVNYLSVEYETTFELGMQFFSLVEVYVIVLTTVPSCYLLTRR
jgi:hypothetical protein